jgi:hydrogenase expression/formation protein HypC
MCLAVPGKIVFVVGGSEITGRIGTADMQGNRVEISLALTPDVQVGDWVLVHAGFAIQALDESDALETWKYLEVYRAGEASTPRGQGKP